MIGRWIWYLIRGQALEGKDVKDLLLNVGSGGGAAPAAGAAAAGAPAAGGDAAPAAEEKVEGTLRFKVDNAAQMLSCCPEKEESDDDMGFGLFD